MWNLKQPKLIERDTGMVVTKGLAGWGGWGEGQKWEDVSHGVQTSCYRQVSFGGLIYSMVIIIDGTI